MTRRGKVSNTVPVDRARTMRRAATAMLVLMGAIFLLSGRYLAVHPAWGFVHAFAEAAMVGGLADWFAVTALFRRPLGLPIPHTAIIPENKDRIADTMAGFLRENFLTPAVVARRMAAMNLAGAVGSYLANPKLAQDSRIRAGASELAVEILESLDPQRLGTQVRAGLAAQVEKLEIAPLLGTMLDAMIADGRHRVLIDRIIRWAGVVLEDNEDMVRTMVRNRANALLRFAGLDERLAESVLDGLYKLLAEVLVNHDHPLRMKIELGLSSLATGLRSDPEMQARVERMKTDLIANPAVADWWQGVWERIRANLIANLRDPGRAVEVILRKPWLNSARRSAATRACSYRSTASPVVPPWESLRAMATRSCGSSRKPYAAGMRARSPTGWKAQSAATSSSFGSTARWSAGWLVSRSIR